MPRRYLDDVDLAHSRFAEMFDELPLWSAPFGILMLDRCPLAPGMTILDVGAGTGFLSLELAQRGGAGTRVIAVDPWAAAMARLAQKIAYLGIENIELKVEDAATLALDDASIDLAVTNLGLNNFDAPERVLTNVHRMLKPDGQIAATSNLTGHMGEFYDVFRKTLIACDKTDRLDALDHHIAHRGSIASVHALLENTGFVPTRTEEHFYRMRFTDGRALLSHFFIRLGFLGAWKTVAGDTNRDAFFAQLEADLNAVAKARGELALTIPMAYFEARKRG